MSLVWATGLRRCGGSQALIADLCQCLADRAHLREEVTQNTPTQTTCLWASAAQGCSHAPPTTVRHTRTLILQIQFLHHSHIDVLESMLNKLDFLKEVYNSHQWDIGVYCWFGAIYRKHLTSEVDQYEWHILQNHNKLLNISNSLSFTFYRGRLYRRRKCKWRCFKITSRSSPEEREKRFSCECVCVCVCVWECVLPRRGWRVKRMLRSTHFSVLFL